MVSAPILIEFMRSPIGLALVALQQLSGGTDHAVLDQIVEHLAQLVGAPRTVDDVIHCLLRLRALGPQQRVVLFAAGDGLGGLVDRG